MSGLGQQIADAREQRGMTAVQAARQLHLRSEFIDAIESEDWRRLGPPSYARGFIRNYAKLVGLDPAVIAEQIDAAVPIQTPAASQQQAQAPEVSAAVIEPEPLTFRAHRAEAPRPGWYPWLLGSMSTLAVVLVIAVLYYTFGPSPREQAQNSVQNSTQISAQDNAPASPAPQDDAIFNGGDAGAANAAKQAGVNLQLQLTQDSWLSVTVDGKRVVYETLPAGTVRDFHGVHEITLRAGNAGGVNATIDGKPIGTLGQHGQVEERKFAAEDPTPTTGPRE